MPLCAHQCVSTRSNAPSARCNIKRDAGRTKGDSNTGAYLCLYFARGQCHLGGECPFLHRRPSDADEVKLSLTHDVFGRERHLTDRDDMGGVGAYLAHVFVCVCMRCMCVCMVLRVNVNVACFVVCIFKAHELSINTLRMMCVCVRALIAHSGIYFFVSGSFSRENRTLYIGGLRSVKGVNVEEEIIKTFAEWGDLEYGTRCSI